MPTGASDLRTSFLTPIIFSLSSVIHSSNPYFAYTFNPFTYFTWQTPTLIKPKRDWLWLEKSMWPCWVGLLKIMTANLKRKCHLGILLAPAVSLLTLLDVFTRSPLSNIKTALSALSADDLASLLRWGEQSGKNIHRSLFQNLVIYLPLDLCALLSLLLAEMIGPAPN